MKTYIYFIVLLISALLLSSCRPHERHIDESIETDSIEHYIPVPTVHDVLEQRQELKYALWCDSVYLSMPEQILTHMLVTKGTTISVMEIVEDYWANRQFYHDTILKSMNIQKKYLPDSIPKKSNTDYPLTTPSHPNN